MRKSLLFAVFLITLVTAGQAQNNKISYQAVVRNSANQLMYDQDLDVTVGIANSETGTAVYTETHAVHSNANGLISLLIGNGTPVAGSNWGAIQWNKAWVTAVVSQGGTELATHHLPLSAVPYALYADQVDPVALANYLTANHYLTEEVQVLSVSNDTLYLTGGSWVKLPQGFSGDYNDLTNLPDLTQYATNVHLNDTLNNYLTISGLCDSIKNCDVITNLQTADSLLNDRITQDSIALSEKIHSDSTYLKDLIDANTATITNNTTNITNNTTNISNITNHITNLQVSDSVLNARFTHDSIALSKRLDTMLTHICDSIEQCAVITNLQTADSLLSVRITRDSILFYRADSVLSVRIINDSVLFYKTDSVLLAHILNDSVLSHQADSILLARILNDSTNLANNYYNKGKINDTLSHYTTSDQIDTLLGNYTTKDTLEYYLTIEGLCDSVKKCDIITNLQIADSLLGVRFTQDSILSHKTDSILTKLIANNADSISNHTTIITNNTTNITNNTTNITNLFSADSILGIRIHSDSVALSKRMDTLLTHVCDSIENCDIITNLQKADSALSARIKADSTNLANNYYTETQVDSIAGKVRSEIGNGKLTIQYGTNDPVTFNANQKTDTSIIIPVPTAPNDATLTIQKNGTTVGTFTANQASNATINLTVPTCDSLANCDLIVSILARLDKLERQNDSLARELEKLKPSLTVAASQDTVTVCEGSTKPVTYTATFHNCSSSDYTIAWKVNSVDSSNVTTPTLTFNAVTAGNYKVVCIATRSDSTYVTDTVTTTVKVSAIPSFDTTVSTLTVNLKNITNTVAIQWDTDSLFVPFSGGTTISHTYSVADTVTITAMNADSCTFSKKVVLPPVAPEVTTDSVPASTLAATTAIAYGTVTSDGGIPSTKRGVVYDTSSTNLKLGAEGVDSVMSGTGKGSFTCNLKRLIPCTQYYVRAFAINDVDTAYGEIKTFTTPSFTCGSTLYDIDGNDYETLLLGSQCWMKQNLRTTHYANGDTILLSTSTIGTTSPYRYEPDSNLTTYGYLYNWYAAMGGSSSSATNPSNVQGVCPDGWHLPSDAEWTQLTDFVASYDNGVYVCGNDPTNIGKSMVSQQGWPESGVGCNIGNTVATNNSTQFSIPSAGTWDCGGGVGTNGVGYSNNGHAIFLSATENDDPTYSVYCREFYYIESIAEKTAPHKTFGRSVRCILDCATGHTYLPTVSTVSLTHTSGTTVSMTASVVSDGGAEVTARGVCWSNSPHPTTGSDNTADSGTGTGEFTVTGSLTPGTTYYVRAYATNSEGTSYGAEVTYIMPNPTYPPTVNTGSQFIALMEGFEGSDLPSTWTTIDKDGDGYTWYHMSDYRYHSGSGCAMSASWYQGQNLTPDNYLITPDITIPIGVSPILTFWYRGSDNSAYWAREHFFVKVGNAGASPVNDFDTLVPETISTNEYVQHTIGLGDYAGQTIRLAFVHSKVKGFNHLCIDDVEVGVAGASAAIVSDVTATTALCGGYVSDDGGATVTARGVCWSTSQNPTINDSHTTDGSGTGSFTSNITGLNPLTTYYVRAYATNSAGTSYGSQVSFKTTEALAKVTTSVVSDVTIDNTTLSATCGGNVTDIGAYAVTARGVCWGTSTNPTISDSHTTDGSGLGSFTSNITGLTGGTYYVRAYATNSAGTAYGNQVSFTLPTVDAKSCSSAPVATDHEGNMYATVQIGTLCWMRENLRTTTSPKTGTYIVKPARNDAGNVYSSLGSKVAHWPAHDSTNNAPKGYGLLYNWCAAMDTASPTTATATYMEVPTSSNINGNNTSYAFNLSNPHRGICPAGWHVPSYQDWNNLNTAISEAGKLAGGNDWESSSNATAPGNYDYSYRNDSKFTALPVGKFNNYNCDRATTYAYFWCSMQMGDPNNARCLYMTHSGNTPTLSSDGVSQGMSVRCVKD